MLAAKTNYPIPFFEINLFLDDVIVFDRSTVKSQIQITSYLRKEAFDVVIIPSTISISNTSHIIGWLTTAPIRVGVNSIDRRKNCLKNLYELIIIQLFIINLVNFSSQWEKQRGNSIFTKSHSIKAKLFRSL